MAARIATGMPRIGHMMPAMRRLLVVLLLLDVDDIARRTHGLNPFDVERILILWPE